METDVTVDRIGEVGAERRRRGLVGHQLGLRGQRQPLEIVPASHVVQACPPERIRRQHVGQSRAQLRELHRAELVVTNL